MSKPILYVGNKNYSSWSLRPFLALKWAKVDFDVAVVPLQGPGYGEAKIPAVLKVSPTGKVPSLAIGDTTIWDSLAISEWAAEQDPTLWPKDPLVRAHARAVVAEMHSGFPAVRRDLSMNLRRRMTKEPSWKPDVTDNIARLKALWGGLRAANAAKGPWLFGDRSVADAFYAPVCARFRTYAVSLEKTQQAYVDTVLSDAAFQEWEQDALKEEWRMPETDALHT